MFVARIANGRASRDEAEKPFWISYADLMTALMVLFLVTMSVALLLTIRAKADVEEPKLQRDAAIARLLDQLEQAVAAYDWMTFSRAEHAVNFGTRAQFPFRSADLDTIQQKALREFVPVVLELADDTDEGRRWLKRVLVVGYTDPVGGYMSNLDLSLERSQSALCALFEPPATDEKPLTQKQKSVIQRLFLAGGFAFNALRESDAASRRVEWRLEFYGLDEDKPLPRADVGTGDFGSCIGFITR